MADMSWIKQTDQPAFADLFWSQPQNKQSAGKLLIVGGNAHSFTAVSSAYTAAHKAGIGTARVAVPESLRKSLAKVFPEAQFAPANAAGSFSRNSLPEILDNSDWAEGLLLAGDFGNNSETVLMLEELIEKYSGPLVVHADSNEGMEYQTLLSRPKTVIVADFQRLQKLIAQSGIALKQQGDLMQVVEGLAGWSYTASLVTTFQEFVVVAANNHISTTAGRVELVDLAAYGAVWHIQQPAKIFEALTSAVYACAHKI